MGASDLAAPRRVSLSAEARRDLRQAVDYYDLRRAGLGQRFVVALVETLDAVIERPASFPLVHLDLRRAIVRRFPYGVLFRRVLPARRRHRSGRGGHTPPPRPRKLAPTRLILPSALRPLEELGMMLV